MNMYSPITDVEFLDLIENLDESGSWGLWEVVVTYDDGLTATGVLQGDGAGSWSAETFEPDDE